MNYNDLLRDTSIDAVIICLPHHLHEDACTTAFSLGKHVLIEKPIASNCEEGERILEASVKSEKTLMVGFNERYLPAYACIRSLLDEYAIGEVLWARTDRF